MSDSYYDKKYFEWQKRAGEFGGVANLFKFEEYISKNSDVLDFGCGGGYLLKNINTFGKKVGVEINPIAREMAEQNGIYCVDDIKKIEENSIDVVITNHALEHVDNPIEIIQEFKRVVRNNGIIVIVVPHEISSELKPYDINMHLYTWSPQNLYNLLTICGIDTLRCERLSHAWIPNHLEVQKQVGWKEFHRLSKIYAEESKNR